VIIGTAGHIDHGKSALIEALTGRRMDRLAEERRRGITIELNFAPIDLGPGLRAGVVDVPGHEDLVRTMAAGASGMDVALLVVAADEGIKPQTREHRAVLEALQVRAGIPVITKADRVEEGWADLVAEEVRAWLAGSPVSFTPPVVVSARTGSGLADLRAMLASLAVQSSGRPAVDLFRLHIDRAFSLPGTGTVVTGTIVSGSVRVGDRVMLVPGGVESRVRAVQTFGSDATEVGVGERAGVALAGVPRTGAVRGMSLVHAGAGWREGTVLDVRLDLAPGAVLKPRTRVRVLHGTAEVMARVQPSPGEPRVARLRLESPLAARAGDRFVVRGYSPVATLGGGMVLDPSPPPRARWLPGLSHAASESRLAALAARRRGGIPDVELAVLTGLPEPEAQTVAAASGLVRAAGRWRQPPRAPEAKVAEPEPADPAREQRLLALAARIESAGLAAPSADELGWNSDAEVPALLREGERCGLIHRLDASHWVGAGAARTLRAILQNLNAEGGITPSALRDRTGLSRKYLIPLLEWSDRQGWTLRRGAVRIAGPQLPPPA
jgi:selenocysteine-specific elongation factor SelB